MPLKCQISTMGQSQTPFVRTQSCTFATKWRNYSTATKTYPSVWEKLPLFSKSHSVPPPSALALGPYRLCLSLPTMYVSPPRPSFCEFPHLIRAAAAPKKCARRARITAIMHTMMVQRKEGGLAPAKYGQMIMRCREIGKRRNLSQPKYSTISKCMGLGWTFDSLY